MDTTYKSHDILRGLSFGLCVVFKMAGIFEVPIMWMDIVIRSPGMNTDEVRGGERGVVRCKVWVALRP